MHQKTKRRSGLLPRTQQKNNRRPLKNVKRQKSVSPRGLDFAGIEPYCNQSGAGQKNSKRSQPAFVAADFLGAERRPVAPRRSRQQSEHRDSAEHRQGSLLPMD